MKRVGIITSILLAVAFAPGRTSAKQLTSGELAEFCAPMSQRTTEFKAGDTVTKDSIQIALCIGYVGGWVEGVNGMAFQSEGKVRDGQMVVVKLVTTNTRQIVEVFILWMKQHPEAVEKPITSGLFAALLEAKLAGFVPTGASANSQMQ